MINKNSNMNKTIIKINHSLHGLHNKAHMFLNRAAIKNCRKCHTIFLKNMIMTNFLTLINPRWISHVQKFFYSDLLDKIFFLQ